MSSGEGLERERGRSEEQAVKGVLDLDSGDVVFGGGGGSGGGWGNLSGRDVD